MELTYKVRGADLKEYGPVALAELSGWLREGRLTAQSDVMRSDMNHWSTAGNFSELNAALPAGGLSAAAVATAAVPTATANNPATEAQLKSGASWCYWIAALSLINSLIALSCSNYNFILGLGVTQIIDGFGMGFEGAGKAIALVLDLIVVGIFVFFGVFANKRKTWAFVVGMVLYGLDSLFALLVQDWLPLGFHGFALFCLFRGFSACRELNAV
jgi:hypothetical protein